MGVTNVTSVLRTKCEVSVTSAGLETTNQSNTLAGYLVRQLNYEISERFLIWTCNWAGRAHVIRKFG